MAANSTIGRSKKSSQPPAAGLVMGTSKKSSRPAASKKASAAEPPPALVDPAALGRAVSKKTSKTSSKKAAMAVPASEPRELPASKKTSKTSSKKAAMVEPASEPRELPASKKASKKATSDAAPKKQSKKSASKKPASKKSASKKSASEVAIPSDPTPEFEPELETSAPQAEEPELEPEPELEVEPELEAEVEPELEVEPEPLDPNDIALLDAIGETLDQFEAARSRARDLRRALRDLDNGAAAPLALALFDRDGDPFQLRTHLLVALERMPEDDYFAALLDAMPRLAEEAPEWGFSALMRLLNTRSHPDDSAFRFEAAARAASAHIREAIAELLLEHVEELPDDQATMVVQTISGLTRR